MLKHDSEIQENSQILIYQSEDGKIKLDVELQQETVWINQEQMVFLFGKAKSTINEHIQNIYKERELLESATMCKFKNSEFQQKAPYYYNLDVIISVGYRVGILSKNLYKGLYFYFIIHYYTATFHNLA